MPPPRLAELLNDLDTASAWAAILALEPGPQRALTETEFDSACVAIADFADIKSPWLLGHSAGVARF